MKGVGYYIVAMSQWTESSALMCYQISVIFLLLTLLLGDRTGGSAVPRCEEKRRELLRSKAEDVSVPTCTADGSYTPVQCYEGYCWCVTPEGKPLPRTSVRGETPNCSQGKVTIEVGQVHRSKFTIILIL